MLTLALLINQAFDISYIKLLLHFFFLFWDTVFVCRTHQNHSSLAFFVALLWELLKFLKISKMEELNNRSEQISSADESASSITLVMGRAWIFRASGFYVSGLGRAGPGFFVSGFGRARAGSGFSKAYNTPIYLFKILGKN